MMRRSVAAITAMALGLSTALLAGESAAAARVPAVAAVARVRPAGVHVGPARDLWPVVPGAGPALPHLRRGRPGSWTVMRPAAATRAGGAASGRPMTPGSAWDDVEEVPGTSALNTGGLAGVSAMSCPSAENCTAAGVYTVSSGSTGSFVDDESGGTWGTAIDPSAELNTDGQAAILSLSCASVGNCAAGGYYDYQSSSDTEESQAFVVSEIDGVWKAAVPVATAANVGDDAQIQTVSCGAPGDCVAGGYYSYQSGLYQAFVVASVSGTWGSEIGVPGVAGGLNVTGFAEVNAVSCTSAGDCSIGGDYADTDYALQAFVDEESGGTWHDAVEVPGTGALNAGGAATVATVSCSSPGNCGAGGTYADASDTSQAFVVSESEGAWGGAAEVAGNLNTDGNAVINTVSCTGSGDCSAAGAYDAQVSSDGVESSEGFVMSESAGKWGTAEEIPGLADLGDEGVNAVTAISCTSPGNCDVGGAYDFTSSSTAPTSGGAFTDSQVDGEWNEAEDLSALSDLNTGNIAEILSLSCPATGACGAGGLYAESSSRFQAFVASETDCQEVTMTDGDYQFGGCVDEEDHDTLDVTDQLSNVDGIDVSASPTDQVSYDDGGSEGNAVVSSGPSTLSLDLDGAQDPVFDGPIDDQLTKPITIDVQQGDSVEPAAGSTPATIGGLPLSGQLTLTPTSDPSNGTLTGKGSVTLPPVLGGGKASLAFTSTVNKGVTSASVTISKATFMQLFSVSNLKLTYKASSGGTDTWTVAEGKASTGGKTSAQFSGQLVYDDDELDSASLKVASISLAGMATISNLSVNYSDDEWTGSAVIGQGSSAAAASIDLQYGDTGLDSGSLMASNVDLFGVLEVDKFSLTYADGTWNLAVTGGTKDSGGSVALTITDGIVTAAKLKLSNLSFLGKFTIASANISYAQEAPDPDCSDVPGEEIWCGSWQVDLPQALAIDGISGSLATDDGQFYQGMITVQGSVPLFEGIFLTKLAGSVTLGPPVTISGDVGLQFGPKVNGTSLLAVDGTLTRTLPDGDTSGSYVASGTLNALNHLKGNITVTVPGDGSPTSIALDASASVGKSAGASGSLSGQFTADSFALQGAVTIRVLGITVDGTMKADDKGMAACGSYKDHEAGFEFDWDTDSVTLLGKAGCSEAGF
jgi:hypothetical protein